MGRARRLRTFKKKRSIRLDYYKQGFVYFICTQYRKLPKGMAAKLDRIVCDVGGFDSSALRKLLFDVSSSVRSVSMEYNLSEGKLNALRDEFYKKAYKELTR